jgi:hypothetical protein
MGQNIQFSQADSAAAAEHARGRPRAESSPPRGARPTRLSVSKPGDASELLAERAAARVLSAQPTDSPAGDGASPAVRPATVAPPAPVEAGEPFVPRGGGEPLPAGVRDFFEPRFGLDLGDVRVHTGADAAEAARAFAARGYAVGRHVVFGAGQFAPGTPAGDRLLAHELAHVVYGAHEPVVHRDAAGPLAVEVPDPIGVFAPGINYPWQNPSLREYIYPARDEALSFFLRTYKEIDLDDPAAKVRAFSAADLANERSKLSSEFDWLNQRTEPRLKELKDFYDAKKGLKGAKKVIDDEVARKLELWIVPLLARQSRLKAELEYLPEAPTTGPLSRAAVKRFAAYWYSKYDDAGNQLQHDALLARVLDRFDADKDFKRYPKWLRYMVVHFSGMRYATAHHSYASAEDLVRRLKSEQIKSTVGTATQTEVARHEEQAVREVESELNATNKPRPGRVTALKARLAALTAVETERTRAFTQKGQEAQRATFVELTHLEDERDLLKSKFKNKTPDAAAQQRLGQLAPLIQAAEAKLDSKSLKGLRERLHAAEEKRSAAVIEHELEKAAKALSTLTDAQALAVLRAMRVNQAFPEWVWRAIVRTTALRLKTKPGEDWERVTPAEVKEQRQKGRWQEIMTAWLQESTLWREKHDKDLSLVVISATCNEIAEMAMHARNIHPRGGISQKAQWYAQNSPVTKFSRPVSSADLTPGTSIFYLKWSNEPAGDPIAVVRSDTVGLQSPKGEPLSDGFKGAGDWTYHFNADKTVTRTHVALGPFNPSGPPPVATEYLNWFHEEQVVEVDETRGRVILFGTDPIGLRTRLLAQVVNVWNVFVGFAPPGAERADLDKFLKGILPGR